MDKKTKKYSEKELAIGIIFKEFRISKGFSQLEAAGNEISVTHLSNFENGKTVISTNHFLNILQNINVNMFEFQNSLNQYFQKKDLLLFNIEMADAFAEKNVSKLRMITEELHKKLEISSTISTTKKYRLDYIRAKSILSFVDSSYFLTKSEITFLENYLYNLKEWGQYDIAILGQCAQFLDFIHLIELSDRMINPSQNSINIPYVKQAIIQTVLNIINIFVDAGLYTPARKFIKYLENIKINDNYMFEKFTLVYNTARYNYKIGDEGALAVMNDCRKALEFCKCFNTSNWIAEEIIRIKDQNSKNN
ncbi:Rgg/GadR/MutR family transcriptional regulator [Lactococcus lactis]|uniref:Rgg/GadR/MutR family transcriptional activator n=4 Tax=Lactococcus lactis TaxID=1358 RepID=A0AAW5TYE0_9LACT|nr:Rgg/GadR/MutR family transcriptional regulator [Lactococcus lactis]MCT3091848.1 Rgg/GadR/MutR family transcriptional regulator [Lactococcus lactis]MCW2282065.1 Rgg/GadR/MutR family transcriptional activator [Lactococcus lactis]